MLSYNILKPNEEVNMISNFLILKDKVKQEIQKGHGIWTAIGTHVRPGTSNVSQCVDEDATLLIKKQKQGKIRYEEGMTDREIAEVNLKNKLYNCF